MRIIPPIGYNFSVSLWPVTGNPNAKKDNYFQKVSGIGGSLQVEQITEGGVNDRYYNLPTGVRFDNLVLERGLAAKNSELGQWCYDTLTMSGNKVEIRGLVVQLLDHDAKKEVMAWTFFNCYPVKWRLSDLQAKESVLAIETLEICYSSFGPA